MIPLPFPFPTALVIRGVIALAVAATAVAIVVGGYMHIKSIGADEVRAEIAPRLNELHTKLEDSERMRDATQRHMDRILNDWTRAQEASDAYQTDLAAIRAERDRLRALPARAVRLCVEPDPSGMLAGDGAGGSTAAATATAQLALAAGPDIGGGLYGLADDGDARELELGAQLRKLQALVAPPPKP
jgi:hypothetical protein